MIRRITALSLLLAAAVLVPYAASGSASALLHLLPALVLLGALIARRYPGERRLLALCPGQRTRRPRAAAAVARRGRAVAFLPRGGLLIAYFLAVRPPPAFSIAP